MNVRVTGCCGVTELVDISTMESPEAVLLGAAGAVLWEDPHYRRPFVYFTGVVERYRGDHVHYPKQLGNYGQALADYITEKGLGEIVASPPKVSHSRNTLRVWIWMPDYESYEKWFADQQPKQAEATITPHIEGNTISDAYIQYQRMQVRPSLDAVYDPITQLRYPIHGNVGFQQD